MDLILSEVVDERKRQDIKWGEQNHDPFAYLCILTEEVGEASKAALEAHDWENETWNSDKIGELREELIQIAAVAVAMVECLDRGKFYERMF
jgi:NTP pyrophosphatase (non-canonical NTP hydrolase)